MASTRKKRDVKYVSYSSTVPIDNLEMSVTSDLDFCDVAMSPISPSTPISPPLPLPNHIDTRSCSSSSPKSPSNHQTKIVCISHCILHIVYCTLLTNIQSRIRPLNINPVKPNIIITNTMENISISTPDSPALPSLRSINKHKTKLSKQRLVKKRISNKKQRRKHSQRQRQRQRQKQKQQTNCRNINDDNSSSSSSSDSEFSDHDDRFKEFERTKRKKRKRKYRDNNNNNNNKQKLKLKRKAQHTPKSPSAPFIGIDYSSFTELVKSSKQSKYHKKVKSNNYIPSKTKNKYKNYKKRIDLNNIEPPPQPRLYYSHSFHGEINQDEKNENDGISQARLHLQLSRTESQMSQYSQINSMPIILNDKQSSYWSNMISSDDTFFIELQSIVTISNDIDIHEYKKPHIDNMEQRRKLRLEKLRKQTIEEEERQKHETILLDILKNQTSSFEILHCIETCKIDVLCYFLPIICFALNRDCNKSWKDKLIIALKKRINDSNDIKQSVIFLLNSYRNVSCIYSLFNDILNINDEENKCIIKFWERLIKMRLTSGKYIDIHNITKKCNILDPVKCLSHDLTKIYVKKVINSNAKPLLLDLYYNKNYIFSSRLILKYGDDLRKDAAVMMLFRWMNYWWLKCRLFYDNKPIKILTYKVVPINCKLGIIELIPNCIPLKQISILAKEKKLTDNDYKNLICSAVGSYIGSYVMGIRDRHYDNILIRTDDCTLFHIDFNYLLGEKINGVDTSQFAITKKLYNVLGDKYYSQFVNLSCKAFQVLRGYHNGLIQFAKLIFTNLSDNIIIEKYLFKKLKLNMSDTNAKKWLIKQLKNAPFNKQTKLKNKIHKIATGGHI